MIPDKDVVVLLQSIAAKLRQMMSTIDSNVAALRVSNRVDTNEGTDKNVTR
jgi:hypothetical protein